MSTFFDHHGCTMPGETATHQIESIEQFADYAYAQGWPGALPVLPPTRKAVDAIIDHVRRDPDEALGTVFPGDGVATIQNVAANCAMAGCLPEHVPVECDRLW